MRLLWTAALVAASRAGGPATVLWRSARRLEEHAAPAGPYRFDRDRYVCAIEGEPCACAGVVTFHYGGPAAPSGVRGPPVRRASADDARVCSRNRTFGAETFYRNLTRDGTCVCHPRRAERPAAKNLLFVDSVGTCEVRLAHVERNVAAYFSGVAWDCIVAVWANETLLPSSRLERLAKVCTIYRADREWGAFLGSLTPAVVQHYARVAVLVDDVELPPSTPAMVDAMARHDLDVYTPEVVNSERWKAMHSATPCLARTRGVEIFFTIFSQRAWRCFYARVRQDFNSGGCGYDLCLHKACPRLKIGVDFRHRAVHTGFADNCTRVKPKKDPYERSQTGNTCVYERHKERCGKGDLGAPGECIPGTALSDDARKPVWYADLAPDETLNHFGAKTIHVAENAYFRCASGRASFGVDERRYVADVRPRARIRCGAETFGGDPAFGEVKWCRCERSDHVAEGAFFACASGRASFGASEDRRHVVRVMPSARVRCGAATFGGDPVSGVAKWCRCEAR